MIRNRNGNLWILILMAAVLVIGPVVAGAQEEIMTLQSDELELKQRPPVDFPHDMHMGIYECLACHHDFEGGENVLDEDDLFEGNEDILCAACHGPGDDPELQEAYHYQCMGCHIQVRKSGQPSGPELCGACHIPQ